MKKKNIRQVLAAFAATAMLASVCLTSCSDKKNDFSFDSGIYTDVRSDAKYYSAPGCYEPIATDPEVYGVINETKFHKIVGLDPEKWLCEPLGNVFYATDVTLPTLDKMDIARTEIVLEDEVLYTVTPDEAQALIDAYAQGERLTRPVWTAESFDVNWRVRFVDETLGLYYVVAYLEFKEDYIEKRDDGTEINHGKRFLYNRFEGVFVAVDGVLEEYVELWGVPDGE